MCVCMLAFVDVCMHVSLHDVCVCMLAFMMCVCMLAFIDVCMHVNLHRCVYAC